MVCFVYTNYTSKCELRDIYLSVFAILIGFKLSRLVSAPIEKLNNIIYFLAKKQDLTKRIRVDTNDELGEMAKALNTLIANLQTAVQETVESTRQVQSAAAKLYTANNNITKEMVNNAKSIPIAVMQDKVNATEETGDNLQELSARLENLSKQFKIFEEESERTSGW